MAKIEGINFQGKRGFSIRPLASATAGEDAVEYEVKFWTDADSTPIGYKFSIDGWQSGHTGLWLIARLFASSSKLIDAKIPMDLWHTQGKESACIYKHCDWLRVVAWALTRQKRICIEFFIQDNYKPDVYRRLFLQTSISDAEQFGKDLEQEIITVAPKWWSENKYGGSEIE